MLRLSLVLPHVMLGGGETAMMEVAEGLRRELDVAVCAFDNQEAGNEPTIRDELVERFGEVRFLHRRWQLLPALADADAVLWYGVVHHVPKMLARMARRPVSVRVVHTDREIDGVGFERRWHRWIDGTVCVSPTVARRIPGAVFIPNTCSPRTLRGPARDFFPSPEGRKTLGFLGRLVALKNVRWLVEHVAELDCNLLVQALDTAQLSVRELRELVERRGLCSRVRFLAPGRDVGTLLRSVDALVLVSRHEGFPMVMVEAGTLGVPVIATRVGALGELFADEILFVDRRGGVPSVGSLRSAIARIGPEWGEKLRHKVVRLCSPDAVVARYAELIHSLCARRAAGISA